MILLKEQNYRSALFVTMTKPDLNSLLAIAAFTFALGSNICWVFALWGTAQKKAYAAERDFNHLKNNQLDISRNLATEFDHLTQKFDQCFKELAEIKAWQIRDRFNDFDKERDK